MRPILQHCVPQHGLSRFGGWLANSEVPWLKNRLIRYFINRYSLNMEEAQETNPFAYPSFNALFTRSLQPHARPIAEETTAFVSPVDGCVSQLGAIQENQLLQAKGHYYSVASLLANDPNLSAVFKNGNFITLYLAPPDYHRIHMPMDGHLTEMIYVPGRLFSVNHKTAASIPNLFARNERVITVFNTAVGQMAVILIGAMIVGSIETVWAGTINPPEHKKPNRWQYKDSIFLKRGEEMGRFKLGSTVIVLMENQGVQWLSTLDPTDKVRFGEKLGILR